MVCISTPFVKAQSNFIRDSLIKEANIFFQIGDSLYLKSQLNSSNKYYLQSAEYYFQAKEWERYLRCLRYASFNYSKLRDAGNASKYALKGIEIGKLNLGENHFALGGLYNALGFSYKIQGKFEKSFESYQSALQILSKYKSGNDLVGTYNNLATLYRQTGRYEEGLQILLICKKAAISSMEKDDPNFSTLYNNLGLFYHYLTDYDKALEYYQQSLQIWAKHYGKNNPQLASVYSNIGNTFLHLKEYEKALINHQKALEMRKTNTDIVDPDITINYNSLGIIYKNLNDLEKALENYMEALELKIKIYGEEHFQVGIAYVNLAMLHYRNNRWVNITNDQVNQNIAYMNKAIEIFSSSSGKDDYIASAYVTLGGIYFLENDYKKALSHYQKSIECNINKEITLTLFIADKRSLEFVRYKKEMLDAFQGIGETLYQRFVSTN